MSKKQLLSLFIGMTLTLTAHGQKFSIAIRINYGSYKMTELKQFQEDVRKDLPVPAKGISSFPSFYGYEGQVLYTMSRFKVGLFASFNSTGSRLSYTDYSGSFEYNQLAKLKQIGAVSEFMLNSNKESAWQPFISMQIGLGRTSLNINDSFAVYNKNVGNENLDLHSNHVTINPGLGLRRTILKWCSVSASAGYLLDDASSLRDNKDSSLYLLNEKNEPISADWSGFRIKLSCEINF